MYGRRVQTVLLRCKCHHICILTRKKSPFSSILFPRCHCETLRTQEIMKQSWQGRSRKRRGARGKWSVCFCGCLPIRWLFSDVVLGCVLSLLYTLPLSHFRIVTARFSLFLSLSVSVMDCSRETIGRRGISSCKSKFYRHLIPCSSVSAGKNSTLVNKVIKLPAPHPHPPTKHGNGE